MVQTYLAEQKYLRGKDAEVRQLEESGILSDSATHDGLVAESLRKKCGIVSCAW